MANLQRQRLELARARQADARANSLMAELEEVRKALAEAEREALGYPAGIAELARLEEAVADARAESDRIEHRVRELDLLTRLWDVLERSRTASQRLDLWEEPVASATFLEEQASELESLRTACSGHLERVRQLADLCNQRAGISQSIEAALGSLGSGWDENRVRTSAGWIGLSDEARYFRSSLANREATWRAALAFAGDAEASLDLAGPVERDNDAASAREPDAEGQARLVAELRRNLAEQRLLVAKRLAASRDRPRRESGLGKTAALPIAIVAIAIAGLGIVAAVVSQALTVRLLCGALAAAGCALFLLALVLGRAKVESPLEATEIDLTCARTTTRIGELAATLGLPEQPSDSDLETLAEQIESARVRERSIEDRRRRSLEALGRLKTAHESLERAREELDGEQARFGEWKATHGLAATLSPDGVIESLATLQTAWSHLAALDRVEARISQLGNVIGEYEVRLAKLTHRFQDLGGHLESATTDPARILEELNAFLVAVLEMRATKSSLLGVIENAESELERSLGFGPDAQRLRAELESGQVLVWTEGQEALVRARMDSRQSLELLVRSHQDASNRLREIASSDEVATLEQKRLTLEHDLEEVLKSWTVLGCARLLLERTLRRHEQERQPAVLARAAERFAKVTEGRYTSVLPSIGEEGTREAIRVVSSSGAELDASALSRGSIEQLYLCLRIGLAENFAERAEALPLILDDVLVNFDPARASSIAEVLAETAEHHQVLFFTCHPHLSELVQRVCPKAQVVQLERV